MARHDGICLIIMGVQAGGMLPSPRNPRALAQEIDRPLFVHSCAQALTKRLWAHVHATDYPPCLSD